MVFVVFWVFMVLMLLAVRQQSLTSHLALPLSLSSLNIYVSSEGFCRRHVLCLVEVRKMVEGEISAQG